LPVLGEGMKSRNGVASRTAVVIALVALVLTSLLAAFEYAQVGSLQAQDGALVSRVANLSNYEDNSTELIQAWLAHLFAMEKGQVPIAEGAVLQAYAPNATMVFSGNTQGLGGTFQGTANIWPVLQTWIEPASTLNITVKSFNYTLNSNGTAEIGAALAFVGYSHINGNFSGSVSASYEYAYHNGGWLISQEDWNFERYVVQYAQV
jgi:hypothetical protein